MLDFRSAVEIGVVEPLVDSVDRAQRLAGLLVNSIPGATALANAINGFLGLTGNDPGNETPDTIAPPPFEGGQCVATYVVTRVSRSNSTSPNCNITETNIPTTVLGPFTVVRDEVTGTTSRRDYFLDRNGNRQGTAGWNVDEDATCGWTGFRYGAIVSVVRQDGQPDDCGNPDRVLPVPLPGVGPIPVPIEYVNRDGDTVNVIGDVSYGPSFTNNGVIVIPVAIAVGVLRLSGELGLDGTLRLQPEININPGGRRPVPGEENPGELPSDEPQPGDEIIGVEVLTLAIEGNSTQIGTTTGPQIIAPRAASVMFLEDDGEVGGWSRDYDVKNTTAFVPVPGNLPCRSVSVTPAPGVTIAWRAVYASRILEDD